MEMRPAKWQGRPGRSPLTIDQWQCHRPAEPRQKRARLAVPLHLLMGLGVGVWGFCKGGKGTYEKALCPLPQNHSSFKLIVVHLHGAEAAAHGALVFFGLGEVPVAPGFGGVDGELDLGVPVQGPAGLGHL